MTVELADNLSGISSSLEHETPEEILRWAVDRFQNRITMATAFGPEGCALIAMLADIRPSVHIFNLETGYQFAETLEVRERIRAKYGINVEYVRPAESVSEMEARFGGPIYGRAPEECCRIRKVEPLKNAIAGYDAWITGIRRDQTAHRAKAGIVEWDSKFNLVKVNPLANWSRRDVWLYILENDVPYNQLHDKGYPSIGCWPCTRAVDSGEDDRSGRWPGLARIECGLHVR